MNGLQYVSGFDSAQPDELLSIKTIQQSRQSSNQDNPTIKTIIQSRQSSNQDNQDNQTINTFTS